MTHTADLNRIELMREFWDDALKRLKARAEAAQRDSEHLIVDPSTDKVLKGRNADLESQIAGSIGTPNEKEQYLMSENRPKNMRLPGFPFSPTVLIRLSSVLVVLLMVGHMSAYPWSTHGLRETHNSSIR